MPITHPYPGVYIEEIPSGVRTITGVATSITAFIGRAKKGPVNEPIRIQSFSDFERTFGSVIGLDGCACRCIENGRRLAVTEGNVHTVVDGNEPSRQLSGAAAKAP